MTVFSTIQPRFGTIPSTGTAWVQMEVEQPMTNWPWRCRVPSVPLMRLKSSSSIRLSTTSILGGPGWRRISMASWHWKIPATLQLFWLELVHHCWPVMSGNTRTTSIIATPVQSIWNIVNWDFVTYSMSWLIPLLQTAFAAVVCPLPQQINPCNFNSSFLYLAAFYLAKFPLEEHEVPEA